MRILSKTPSKRLFFRWSTFKGLIAVFAFLVIALLLQYLIVIYAVNLGVVDDRLLQGSFTFPGTDWIVTISISPLFHLIPLAVVISLAFSWSYLTKNVAVRPRKRLERQAKKAIKKEKKDRFKNVERFSFRMRAFFIRLRRSLLRIKGVSYLWRQIHFARATIKSGLAVLLVFGIFILLISLLAYPKIIQLSVSNSYKTNPSLLNFIKAINNIGTSLAETLSPIGWICSALNTTLLSIAPGFRELTLRFGGLMKPLVELDPVGKYLAFQNIAVWISALATLFYAKYRQRIFRYKRH